jgi:hypothetical protein
MTPGEPQPFKKFSEQWWENYAHGDSRCVAHRKNGDQCRRPARLGATVCRHHGGAAPQVQAKARERLELAQDRMARELLHMATGAQSEAVKLAAIRDALDRVMGKATTTVEVGPKKTQPYEDVLNDIVGVAQITRAESQARQGLTPEPRALAAPEPMEVVDAELVDEPEHGPRGRTPADRPDDPTGPDAPRTGPPSRPPGRELATLEDATADAAAANRAAARLGRLRRMR